MAAFSVINYSETSDKQVQILRKHQKIAPAMSGYNNILITNESKRKGRVKDVIKVQNPPPPIAVARRNARERNRVKQVNNGFAVLRQHIPSSITSTTEENGRSKKLSKVETLRMAVEYIRRLEDLLALSNDSTEDTESMSSYTSYIPNDQQNFQIKQEIEPKRYNYQLIYEDDENIHPEMTELDEDMLSDGLMADSRNINFIHSMSTGSLSPEINSEHSLSPRALEDSKQFIIETDSYSRIKFNEQIDNDNNHLMVTSWWEQEQLKS